ncbi:MAG: leucyl aminopeptidase [Tissierellia bacterium]|nr:leucyl aminopeptidase [Tissierellia bacterium]
MNFQLYTKGGLPVYFHFEDAKEQGELATFALDHGFKGKRGEAFYLPGVKGEGALLLGLGETEKLDEEAFRLAGHRAYLEAKKYHEAELEFTMPEMDFCNRKTLMSIYEGLYQGSYAFSHKTEDEDEFELTINYTPFKGKEEKIKSGKAYTEAVMDGVFFARELTNETSNIITPELLAEAAESTLSPLGVNVTVYEEEELSEMGFDAFLAVAKGSENGPRLIVMEYRGDEDSDDVTGLVGKGLTYDSGGYCIKSPGGMVDMHSDMAGSATVMGTLLALAKAQAKVNVTGVVAACENLISGSAYKTGDIISSLSGKTIEVGNTDAEGRLTLADAIYYATSELKVNRVIDLATLTGAAVVGLGHLYTAALTNDEEFYAALTEAAKAAGEKIWPLPNDPAYKKQFSSKVADLKNTGRLGAGTITAGQFVGEFVHGDTPWIHLDIAGTAYLPEAMGYLPARATGVQVKTLFRLLHPLQSH